MSETMTVDGLQGLLGQDLGTSDWFVIDQQRIDDFADVTLDHQFVHVDVDRASKTPFGGTIAHGLLTLSLIVHLCLDFVPKLEGTQVLLNYGFDRVRFPAPVKSGSRVRATGRLAKIEEKQPNHYLLTMDVEIEIENESKPGLVAQWLSYHVVGDADE